MPLERFKKNCSHLGWAGILPHPNPLPLGEGTAMFAFFSLNTVFSNPAVGFCLKLGAFRPGHG